MRRDRAGIAETRAFASEFAATTAQPACRGPAGRPASSLTLLPYCFSVCVICWPGNFVVFAWFQSAARDPRLAFAADLNSVFAPGFVSTSFEGMPPSADAAAKLMERISPI